MQSLILVFLLQPVSMILCVVENKQCTPYPMLNLVVLCCGETFLQQRQRSWSGFVGTWITLNKKKSSVERIVVTGCESLWQTFIFKKGNDIPWKSLVQSMLISRNGSGIMSNWESVVGFKIAVYKSSLSIFIKQVFAQMHSHWIWLSSTTLDCIICGSTLVYSLWCTDYSNATDAQMCSVSVYNCKISHQDAIVNVIGATSVVSK